MLVSSNAIAVKTDNNDMSKLNFCQDLEAEGCPRFWVISLVKICRLKFGQNVVELCPDFETEVWIRLESCFVAQILKLNLVKIGAYFSECTKPLCM